MSEIEANDQKEGIVPGLSSQISGLRGLTNENDSQQKIPHPRARKSGALDVQRQTGVGTALSDKSRVWFTPSHGIFNEIYYPRIDQACVRDMGLTVTDGAKLF